VLKNVDFITPNKSEAFQIAALGNDIKNNKELLFELKNRGSKTVIITLGDEGVLFSQNGQISYQESKKVDVIDTTAAGDTFNGYLAVALAKGESLDKAVRFANSAASLSVTRLGASTSIPYFSEIVV